MSQPKLAQKIRYHAYKARTIIEDIAKREDLESDLRGLCARGSSILWEELDRGGLKSEIVYNPGHVFVYCQGWYVDITATQFGLGRTIVCNEATAQKLSAGEYNIAGQKVFPDWHRECAFGVFKSSMEFKCWQDTNGFVPSYGIIKPDDSAVIKKQKIARLFERKITQPLSEESVPLEQIGGSKWTDQNLSQPQKNCTLMEKVVAAVRCWWKQISLT
ncbi:MAG: hypothetical protein WC523_04285 [Patescibacteria group bacterium]